MYFHGLLFLVLLASTVSAYGGPYPGDEVFYTNKIINYNATFTYTLLDVFELKSEIPIDCFFYKNNNLVSSFSNVTKCVLYGSMCRFENYTIFISSSQNSVEYFTVGYFARSGACFIFLVLVVLAAIFIMMFLCVLISISRRKFKNREKEKLLNSHSYPI